MIDLERRVHTCERCRKEVLDCDLPYPPVYSFGDPQGKEVMVVGINPSQKEYTEGHLLDHHHSIDERRKRQLTYFDRPEPYKFFDELGRFFGGEVKSKLQYRNKPWEKVGYLDLVKCPTVAKKNGKQWSALDEKYKEIIVRNCEGYLLEQLKLYGPKLIIAYGKAAEDWFSKQFHVKYEDFEDYRIKLDGEEASIIFVPQRQGNHSKPEVIWVQNKILKNLA